MKSKSSEKISVIALVLLITGAIDSIRNLPSTALFGPTLFFFFLLASIIFLLPVALVSAELAATWSEEQGGIYSWVKHAFGKNFAFLTIWLQWINTIVWYPSILSFIAGTMAYLINPSLANSKIYLISIIISIFWLLTFLGLNGLKASAAFASFCAIVGMILPMGLLIILALVWLLQGNPIAIDINMHTIIPHWGESQSWVSLTAMVTSFVGMELAAVHVRDVRSPQKNFPKAIMLSVCLILITMILGSLAITFVLPPNKISLVDAVMEAFQVFLHAYNLEFLLPVIVMMIFIGSVGCMINWIISPAKGLLIAADHGFLPQWLQKRNQKGIASRILILQATLVTFFCGAFLLLPSINAIYWLFTALSTELYLLMYVLLFIAAIRIKSRFSQQSRSFQIPGGKKGYYLTCILGLIGCCLSLIVGFIPPAEVNAGSTGQYQLLFASGIILMLLPAFILYWRRNKRQSKS